MNQLLIDYAKVLDEIDDRIIYYSQQIYVPEEQELSKKELKMYYDTLNSSLVGVKECQSLLVKTKPPINIKEEHQGLINSFNGYVSAIRTLINSVDFDRLTYNKKVFRKGLSLVALAEVSIKSATDTIVNKILN